MSQWPNKMEGPCQHCGDTVGWENAGTKERPRYVTESHDCNPTPYHQMEEYYWGDRD